MNIKSNDLTKEELDYSFRKAMESDRIIGIDSNMFKAMEESLTVMGIIERALRYTSVSFHCHHSINDDHFIVIRENMESTIRIGFTHEGTLKSISSITLDPKCTNEPSWAVDVLPKFYWKDR